MSRLYCIYFTLVIKIAVNTAAVFFQVLSHNDHILIYTNRQIRVSVNQQTNKSTFQQIHKSTYGQSRIWTD